MSATAIAAANFDYTDFDKDDKGKLINLAGQIKKARDLYDDSLFDLGEVIAHAHGVLTKHGSGSFVKWIESETGIENTTAYNYMYAWMRFHGFPNRNMLTAGAMYKLSAPKAPPAAAKEAEKLANKGERVTEAVASELVKKHKPEKPAEKVCSPVGKTEPVAEKQVTKNGPAKTEPAKPPKEDKGTSFDTAKLDAAPAPKPPKNGAAVKPEFDDAQIEDRFVKLAKLIDDRWELMGGVNLHRQTAAKHLKLSYNAWLKWRDK